jgi:succinate dehydrogenase / fumarate reductase flavoprotein subunit
MSDFIFWKSGIKYGNLVPRDIATRAIHRIVYQEKLGLAGQAAVYLDVSHIPKETLIASLKAFWKSTKSFWESIRAKSQ